MANLGGREEAHCVFVETNTDTRLALLLHNADTVSVFKENFCKEHKQSFPDLGEIRVSAVKVKRGNHYYHLPDSMMLSKVFKGISENWFVDVDVVKVVGSDLLTSKVVSRNELGVKEIANCSNLASEGSLQTNLDETKSNKRKQQSVATNSSRHDSCGKLRVEAVASESWDDHLKGGKEQALEHGEKASGAEGVQVKTKKSKKKKQSCKTDNKDEEKDADGASENPQEAEMKDDVAEEHEVKNDVREETGDDQETVAEDTKDEGNTKALMSDIKRALRKRASYIQANSEEITMDSLRRLLEEDLDLKKDSLVPFHKFINKKLDEVLQIPDPPKHSTEPTGKNVKKKVKSTPSKKIGSEEDFDSDGEDDEEVAAKKNMTQKRKRKVESGKPVSRKKKAKHTETDPKNDIDAGDSEMRAEKPLKQVEDTATTVYGKRAEHLKPVIKSCGMSVPPVIYREVKQAPEEKREATLIEELEQILAKEGQSSDPSEKDRKNLAEEVSSLETRVLSRCFCQGQKDRKLVVFDLNGIFADIVRDYKGPFVPDGRISNRAVFRRPFVASFLDFCFERFDVGIWSSRRIGLDYMTNIVIGKHVRNLLFSFDQHSCITTKFNTLENNSKPLFLKDLKRVWNHFRSCFNCGKQKYNETNTLLVDDSPYKALCNPPYTGIFPHPYQYTDRGDDALGSNGELRKYMEKLADAENIQKFVQENPFGQTIINERHESWEFYSKVVEAYK